MSDATFEGKIQQPKLKRRALYDKERGGGVKDEHDGMKETACPFP